MLYLGPDEIPASSKTSVAIQFVVLSFQCAYNADIRQATLNLHDACDAILDAYEQLGEAMPVLSQFTSLLSTNRHTQRILIHIYEDILEFHLHTLQIFSRPSKIRVPYLRCLISVN